MIFCIISILLFLITFFVTPKERRHIDNPILSFLFLWNIILFLATLRLDGLLQTNNTAYFCITTGLASTAITYCIFTILNKKNTHTQATDTVIKNNINYRFLHILAIICIIFYIPQFIESLVRLINGADIVNIRLSAQNYTSDGSFLSKIIIFLQNFIILPSCFTIEVFSIVDYWFGKRDKKLLALTIAITLIRFIVDGGRTPIVNLLVYFIVAYILHGHTAHKEEKQKSFKNKKKPIIISVCATILIIVTSMLRTNSTLSRQAYFYFSMPPVMLSQWNSHVETKSILTFGATSVNGALFTAAYPIVNALNTSYPDFIAKPYDLIAKTDSEWKKISTQGTTANAYVSLFWFFYTDGRLLGVILGCCLYALLLSKYHNKVCGNSSTRDLAIFLLLFQGMCFSFIRFPFAKHYYVVTFIFIILATINRKANNVSHN